MTEMTSFQKFRDSLVPGSLLEKVGGLYITYEKFRQTLDIICKNNELLGSEIKLQLDEKELGKAIIKSQKRRKNIPTSRLEKIAKVRGVSQGLLCEVVTYLPVVAGTANYFLNELHRPSPIETSLLFGVSLILRCSVYNSTSNFSAKYGELLKRGKKIIEQQERLFR